MPASSEGGGGAHVDVRSDSFVKNQDLGEHGPSPLHHGPGVFVIPGMPHVVNVLRLHAAPKLEANHELVTDQRL
jgi:hypothetical protein